MASLKIQEAGEVAKAKVEETGVTTIVQESANNIGQKLADVSSSAQEKASGLG